MTTQTSTIRYNIVSNEGVPSSVTVFLPKDEGGTQVATAQHKNFQAICDYLAGGGTDTAKIVGLFDINKHITNQFARFSERVMARNGEIFFDGDPINNALGKTIMRFVDEGEMDFMPLVNFFEKIMQNPSEHSREHLYRWLEQHRFSIAPDGDFIAYKGVEKGGVEAEYRSQSSGAAIVNGVPVTGKIPNVPGTIVEMPRSQVTFDPRQGCSRGLHAGNWGYAKGFTNSGIVLKVKINPRDVVSVPTDSSDQKLRVCRYRVLDRATHEDMSLLYLGVDRTRATKPQANDDLVVKEEAKAPAKPAAKKAAGKKAAAAKKAPAVKKAAAKVEEKPKEHVFPDFYEQYSKADFQATPYADLRWLAKEWDVKGLGSAPKGHQLADALAKEAAKRLKTWDKK